MEEKKLSFRRDIVLDKDALGRIDRMLKEFFSDVSYECKRNDKSKSSDKKCKDVLEEINGGLSKLVSLKIQCRNKGINGVIADATIEIESNVELWEPSVTISFAFENEKTSLAFEQMIRREIDGCSANSVLFWVGKIAFGLFAYFFASLLAYLSKEVFGWRSSLDVIASDFIGFATVFLLYKKFRPSVWFKWGKMLNANRITSKIFWAVFVGGLVGYIITKLP